MFIIYLKRVQCIFENNNWVANGFTAENLGGTGDPTTAFESFKTQRIKTSALRPWDSWSNCESGRNKILCGPCTDNDNIAQFRGFIGFSALSAVSINIPENLDVVLEFCVYSYEGARNLTTCA